MNCRCVAALVALAFLPTLSSAVDIKNVRPCYGPQGPTRYSAKCLPGDIFFMTYEIEGLAIDPKTKKVKYQTLMELLGADGKVLSTDQSTAPIETSLQLGGTAMPGDLRVVINPGTKPGRYKIRLTINDKIAKNAKAFEYSYEVLPDAFGFIRFGTTCVGFVGTFHVPEMVLVNLKLDGKTKMPDAKITVSLFDSNGKLVSEPGKMILPRDLPEDGKDLQKANLVPLTYPVYLNRPGVYTVEIVAIDNNDSKKEARLRYKMTVLDISQFAK